LGTTAFWRIPSVDQTNLKVRKGSILSKNPVWNGRDSGWRWLSGR